MIKIIWRQDTMKSLAEELSKKHSIKIIEDTEMMSDGHIGIMIDDKNYDQVKSILETIITENHLSFFETKEGWVQLDVRQIIYIESFGEDVYMHLLKNQTYVVKDTLYALESALRPYHLIRISKSYIVNVLYIKFIRTSLNGKLDLELMNNQHLEVTRSYTKAFKEAIGLTKKEH